MHITIPTINEGEHYVGIIIAEGKHKHHVILLAGELDAADWNTAKAWAIEQGGELPTRREQALLFANAPEQFKPDWYWSGEHYAANSYYAWSQDFYLGYQSSYDISIKLRARAVRRVAI